MAATCSLVAPSGIFGQDVEALCRQPVRTDKLERLHIVSQRNQLMQREKADVHSSGVDLHADMQLPRRHHLRS